MSKIGIRYDAEEKAALLEKALKLREDGAKWYKIAKELGVTEHTLQQWAHRASKTEPKPVQVTLKSTPEAFMIRTIKNQLKGITEAVYELEGYLK